MQEAPPERNNSSSDFYKQAAPLEHYSEEGWHEARLSVYSSGGAPCYRNPLNNAIAPEELPIISDNSYTEMITPFVNFTRINLQL